MSKIKINKTETKEIETEYEYPVYLYFQDENGSDELVMVDDGYQIQIKFTSNGFSIKKGNKLIRLEEYHLSHNQTPKEHFEETLKEAVKHLLDCV